MDDERPQTADIHQLILPALLQLLLEWEYLIECGTVFYGTVFGTVQ